MAYTKNNWKSGDKVTSEKLNNIENGIEEVNNNTKVIGEKLSPLEVGDRIDKGYTINLDNVQLGGEDTTYNYTFKGNKGIWDIQIFAYNNGIIVRLLNMFGELKTSSDLYEYDFTLLDHFENFVIEDEENDYYTLTEKKVVNGDGNILIPKEAILTAQEVYDELQALKKSLNA